MSTISPQSVSSGFGQGEYQSSGSKELDMQSFLVMFTTQLKYQDPSNPLQSHELAAQLAQFSTVEKLTEINSNLLAQQSYLASINSAQMVDVLGKQVIGLDNTLRLQEGEISSGHYQIDLPAEVAVRIVDEEGRPVRTMVVGPQDAGQYDIAWDGRDDAGEAVPDGNYHFEVDAVSAEGNTLDVLQTISGKATAFRMEEGIPYLILGGTGGIKLPIGAVKEVYDPAEA